MIIIIDFEDSFIYNVYSEIKLLSSTKIEIIRYGEVETYLKKIDSKKISAIVWGPGPGSPKDYFKYKKTFLNLLSKKKLRHLGICLGHQLIWSLLGAKISKSSNPSHGQKKIILFGDEWGNLKGKRKVQYYSSLVIDYQSLVKISPEIQIVLDENGEVAGTLYQNILTYQFHPESIGTSCQNDYFSFFLYNEHDGDRTKS